MVAKLRKNASCGNFSSNSTVKGKCRSLKEHKEVTESTQYEFMHTLTNNIAAPSDYGNEISAVQLVMQFLPYAVIFIHAVPDCDIDDRAAQASEADSEAPTAAPPANGLAKARAERPGRPWTSKTKGCARLRYRLCFTASFPGSGTIFARSYRACARAT